MDILTAFYKWLMNLFLGFNQPDNKVVCEVDGDPVACFTFKLEEDGYTLDEEKKLWSRTCTTNEGKESILEIYQQDEEGWKKLMIGYGDQVIYEERVNES